MDAALAAATGALGAGLTCGLWARAWYRKQLRKDREAAADALRNLLGPLAKYFEESEPTIQLGGEAPDFEALADRIRRLEGVFSLSILPNAPRHSFEVEVNGRLAKLESLERRIQRVEDGQLSRWDVVKTLLQLIAGLATVVGLAISIAKMSAHEPPPAGTPGAPETPAKNGAPAPTR